MAGRIEASSSSSSSYASTAGSSTTYDVFLNFRGDDTRKSFTGHLYRALTRERIHVFMDSYELWEGEEIGPKLLDAIQRSKVSIPVFSKGYADSKWCLMELAKMLECHRTNDQIVLPIFLDVDPSDVRHQTGSFKEAFLEHDKKYEAHIVQRWRDALSEVGKLKGWVLDEVENGDESKLVKLVVERSLRETSSNFLSDIEYGIGLESRVNDLVSLVNSDSKDIQFIGICGIGGIGKTTIAKALYNRVIERFCQSCFLANIREEASRPNGLVSLQEELVYNISHRKIRGEIFSVDLGKELIKRRLQGENVLLILDDVDHRSQLKAFGIDRNWLGQGSMVVITTRDEKILNAANIDEDKIYWPKELDFDQSLQLFSLHAFQKDEPSEEYMELSHAVTNYSGGLPLTLEVLGSSLSDVKSKEVWECTIKKLRETPPKDVYESLKISYDNLEENYEKAIFLDSACFFNGWEKETLISLWEACGYHPKSTLQILIKRSLLKFECRFDENCGFSKYYMKMHDQIRDMGRKIVADESFKEPGKSSRLWSLDEILEVLEGHKGTDMIKGMILPSDLPRPRVYLDNKHFEMMSNLRFLDISLANFRGEFSCLPFALRWLRWRTCPWSILPINFCHERLVYLDFSKSNIKEAWNMKPQDKNKRFQNLKVLDLSGCTNLSKSPNFSWFLHLERLDLGGCYFLDKLDESIEQLSQLKSLILFQCLSIMALPDGVGLLEKLEVLDVGGCAELVKLPRSMRRMRCLRTINLRYTDISKFPDDFSMLHNLEELNISAAGNHCQAIQANASSGNYLEIPRGLEYLPELPPSLVKLDCSSCYSLVRLPDLSRLKNLTILSLEGCRKLEEIRGLEGTESLEELNARCCCEVTHTRRKLLGQGTFLSNRSWQNRYSLTANGGVYELGLILCIVLEFQSERGRPQTIDLDITAHIRHNKDKVTWCFHTLRIEDVAITTGRDTIYIHHFKGFEWFGIPLQGKEAIEILAIKSLWDGCTAKFWEVLSEKREPDQPKPNQNLSAMMVAHFFNWSYVEDDGGVAFPNSSLSCLSGSKVEGSNSVPQQIEEEERMEGEGSDSVPQEIEEEERMEGKRIRLCSSRHKRRKN